MFRIRCLRPLAVTGLLVCGIGQALAAPAQEPVRGALAQWLEGQPEAMDAAERELYLALEAWSGQPLDDQTRTLLEQLTTLPVRATVPHHEVPALRQPRWPVAQRAQGLLEQDQARRSAGESAALLGQPSRWLAAYRSAPRPQDWRLPLAGKALARDLATLLQDCAASDGVCADALLAQGVSLTPDQFDAASTRATPDALVRAVADLDAHEPTQRAVLERAQAHPATAALATHRLNRAAVAPDLDLLADPDRGAALAAALATRLDDALITQLADRYARSTRVLEQQRLLLVLHLHGTPRSRATLSAWLHSAATLAGTREAAQSW